MTDTIPICWGCDGAGILATPDGEDAFECTICEGSGLADSAGGPILGYETDADGGPEPTDGDHGTCAYLVGRGAEGTAVCGYEVTLRAERTVLMADGTDGHGQPGGREILVWRHDDVAIDYMHRAQIGEA